MPITTRIIRFLSHATICLTDWYCIFQDTIKTFAYIRQYYLRSYQRFRKVSEELKVLLKRMPLRAIKKCAGSDAGAILHLAHEITAAWYLFNYLNCIVSYPRCDNSLLLCKSVVSKGTRTSSRKKKRKGWEWVFLRAESNQTMSLRFFFLFVGFSGCFLRFSNFFSVTVLSPLFFVVSTICTQARHLSDYQD